MAVVTLVGMEQIDNIDGLILFGMFLRKYGKNPDG